MVLALKKLGCDITASSTKGYLYRRDFPLHRELQEIIAPPGDIDVCLAFEYPPNYKNLRGAKKVAFLTYESSRLPEHWVEPINDYIDILIVPSAYCFESFKESGVDTEKMRIVPYGFNPEHFRPREDGETYREEFRFLFVGTPHKRKGLREAVEAFVREFNKNEKAELVVHTSYNPADNKRVLDWEYPDVRKLLREIRNRHAGGACIHWYNEIGSDEDMGRLFRNSDCLVNPCYSEGFGLATLEAMASAVPVIVTDTSGHRDYCSEENSCLIRSSMIPAGDFQYDSKREDARVAKPDVAHLQKLMRRVFRKRKEAAAKARRALKDISHLTWQNAAKKLLNIIEDVAHD